MFKDLAGFGSVLKQFYEIRSRAKAMSEELKAKRVSGTAGGGLVEVEVNGLVEVTRCRIDPSLLKQQDAELLEDLVATAINQAIAKAKQLHQETMQSLTGGFGLPGIEQAMGDFLKHGDDSQPPQSPESEQPPKA